MRGRREHHPFRPVALVGLLVILIVGGAKLLSSPTAGGWSNPCPVTSPSPGSRGHPTFAYATTALQGPQLTAGAPSVITVGYVRAGLLKDCSTVVRRKLRVGGVLVALVFLGVLGAFILIRSPRDPQ